MTWTVDTVGFMCAFDGNTWDGKGESARAGELLLWSLFFLFNKEGNECCVSYGTQKVETEDGTEMSSVVIALSSLPFSIVLLFHVQQKQPIQEDC